VSARYLIYIEYSTLTGKHFPKKLQTLSVLIYNWLTAASAFTFARVATSEIPLMVRERWQQAPKFQWYVSFMMDTILTLAMLQYCMGDVSDNFPDIHSSSMLGM